MKVFGANGYMQAINDKNNVKMLAAMIIKF